MCPDQGEINSSIYLYKWLAVIRAAVFFGGRE